jgi:hypothetical protein
MNGKKAFQFKALHWHLPEGTKENQENLSLVGIQAGKQHGGIHAEILCLFSVTFYKIINSSNVAV